MVGEAEMLLLVATQLRREPWWARLRPEMARTFTVLSALLSRETSIIISSGQVVFTMDQSIKEILCIFNDIL